MPGRAHAVRQVQARPAPQSVQAVEPMPPPPELLRASAMWGAALAAPLPPQQAATAPAPLPQVQSVTDELLHTASNGLIGLHDTESANYSDAASAYVGDIQRHLRDLHSSPAHNLNPRVVEAALHNAGDAGQLVNNLVALMTEDPTISAGEPQKLVSSDALDEVLLALAGADSGHGLDFAHLSQDHRGRMEAALQALSTDRVSELPIDVLLAAVEARGNVLVLAGLLENLTRDSAPG